MKQKGFACAALAAKGNQYQVSNQKNLGCLEYIGKYTTQLYRILISHYKDPV